MLLTEYDEEKTLASYKEEGREEGLEKGREKGHEEIIALLEQGYSLAQIKELCESGNLIVAESATRKKEDQSVQT